MALNFNATFNDDLNISHSTCTLNRRRNGLSETLWKFENIDTCDLLQANNGHYLLKHIAERIHRFSNLALGCPLKRVI